MEGRIVPVMDSAEFKRHVSAGALYPLYLLFGSEKYTLAKGRDRLIKTAVADNFREFNLNEFSGDSPVDSIADAALALPFMAERKVVAVSDLNVEKIGSVELSKLTELVSDPSDATVLIFALPTINPAVQAAKWKSFVKLVEKNGAAVNFEPLTTGELVKFICSAAEKHGSRITKSNAEKIIRYAGTDMNNLKNEVDKLSAFVGEGEITGDIVENMVQKNLETTVFILINSVLSGDYAKAYSLLGLLFSHGEKGVPILAAFSTAFVDLYRVRTALESGKSAQAPAAYGDYKGREFRLRNAEKSLRGISTQKLTECLNLLVETDLLLKGSRLSDKVILEEMLAKFLVILKGVLQ